MKNEFRAIPVMIPGSAIGRTNTNETASCPKNAMTGQREGRQRAEGERDGCCRRPALTESQSASRTSSSCHAAVNHFVVKPGIGQLWMFDELNA